LTLPKSVLILFGNKSFGNENAPIAARNAVTSIAKAFANGAVRLMLPRSLIKAYEVEAAANAATSRWCATAPA
jgi:hypothetical protein